MLRKIWQALPTEVRALFTEPVSPATVHTGRSGTRLMSQGYTTPELERFRKNDGWSSRDGGYYRIVIGNYGNKSIIKLNDGISIDEKQLKKVVTATRDSIGALRAAVNRISDGEAAQAAELLRHNKPRVPELATRMEQVAELADRNDIVGAVSIAMDTLREFEEAA